MNAAVPAALEQVFSSFPIHSSRIDQHKVGSTQSSNTLATISSCSRNGADNGTTQFVLALLRGRRSSQAGTLSGSFAIVVTVTAATAGTTFATVRCQSIQAIGFFAESIG